MVSSQQLAEAAALCQLGIPFRVLDTVTFGRARRRPRPGC